MANVSKIRHASSASGYSSLPLSNFDLIASDAPDADNDCPDHFLDH
jgi:hypothetical protein